MKDTFFLGLLIFLQLMIFINIQFLRLYIANKKAGSFKILFTTTSIIFIIGVILLIVMMLDPDVVAKFQMQRMMVLESGLIFCFLVYIKARITIRVLKRVKDPEYYDISFFGKKVYRLNVVKKSELAIYILSMPVTLIAGAYFLVNVFAG
ncbi:MAG TPA: hypothetical protein PKG60_13375 [Spirochaetota bacterium]|nr:hypothetical protein [Spirochaetota bacterium]